MVYGEWHRSLWGFQSRKRYEKSIPWFGTPYARCGTAAVDLRFFARSRPGNVAAFFFGPSGKVCHGAKNETSQAVPGLSFTVLGC